MSSAMLVDVQCKVASEVAIGAPAILQLAGVRLAQAQKLPHERNRCGSVGISAGSAKAPRHRPHLTVMSLAHHQYLHSLLPTAAERHTLL